MTVDTCTSERTTVDVTTAPRIVAVASDKGGVGKSTIAAELAAALGAVLVDLDHASGSLTAGWPDVGMQGPEFALRALTNGDGPGPRLVRRQGWPDLIPAHRHYGAMRFPRERVVEALEEWSQRLGRTLVVDTHPGWSDLSLGAAAAAHLVLVPVLLEERSLRAFGGFARDAADYPLAAVPSRVPRWGGFHVVRVGPLHKRLVDLATQAHAMVAPAVSEWREWPQRHSLRPLIGNGDAGRWVREAQDELVRLADWVRPRA